MATQEQQDAIFQESFKEYSKEFTELIQLLQDNNIVISEDFCKVLCTKCLKIYNIGYKAGVDKGCELYEQKIAESLSRSIMKK